ncbi:uncharacterized protein DFL_007624 [Arthrobotrys flagrans]|uniref:Ricin B lectin domain-containing protein n=1 Tax=Arthrobotrys flagrans TaxID=97331 RepID=A0A436ZW82_ARTFL|nr:hypothetical protein DFL_007624 [Arthrobotrys flagrans]
MKAVSIGVAACLAAIAQAELSKIVKVDVASQQFIDAEGRSRHFHGTNMVKKRFPFHEDIENFVPGYSVVDRDIQFLKDLNVNCVRLGVHWAGVEPVRGKYNQTYLDVTTHIIKKFEENGIYTMIDQHQDVWSAQTCGHGAPLWFVKKDWVKPAHRMPYPQKAPFAVDANGVPSDDDCNSIDWAVSYLDFAPANAFGRLYNNYDGLGDAWAAYWKVLAKEYGTYTGVMGYDLMNEPWVGDHHANPLLLIPGVGDRENMEPLWNKGNDAIRQVDNTTIVMFEGSTYDILAGFNNVPGGDGSKTAHSYHYYKPPQIGSIETTIKNRIKDATRLKTGGILTEFEMWGSSIAGPLEAVRVADKYLQSWTAWSYEELFDRSNMTSVPYPHLARVYARTFVEATAGTTKATYFDDSTGKYWVSWTANTAIKAPGLIRIVPKSYYPDGIRIITDPPNVINWKSENENVIQLHYTDKAVNGQAIKASVQPLFPTGPITNSASGGKCMDVFNATVLPNNPVILFKCTGPDWNQVWKFKQGTIQLAFDKDNASGKYCLDTQPGIPGDLFLNVVLNPCKAGKASQQWKTTPTGNIVNVASGFCVDINASNYKDGTKLLAFTCGNKQKNQVWTLPGGVDGVWSVLP